MSKQVLRLFRVIKLEKRIFFNLIYLYDRVRLDANRNQVKNPSLENKKMSDEAKAQQYLQDAEKKSKSSGSLFSSMFG